MRSLAIMTSILLLACTSTTSVDTHTDQFAQWTVDNEYSFDEYIALEFSACHYCHDQVVKFIQDGHLDRLGETAFVLVLYKQSELYPIQEYVGHPNLLIYDIQKEQDNIVDMSPRIYKLQEDGTLSFESINASELKQKIDKMIEHITTYTEIDTYADELRGVPIPGHERFVAYLDSARYKEYVYHFELTESVEN